jgi:hypothetical protein
MHTWSIPNQPTKTIKKEKEQPPIKPNESKTSQPWRENGWHMVKPK